MAKISLAGFTDPARRPRYIIWTGVTVLMLAAVMIVALGVTSTRWFCSEGCHKVQDDTIIAYQHSSHSEISCMACHMPVNASPITFMLHKVEALGELYLTVTDNFELPLNAESEVSLAMKTTQCTQCHNLDTRQTVTPSEGIVMEHKPHDEIGVACPVCHNRVAHREDFQLVGVDPKSGELSHKHADFMTMQACFRCHGLEKGAAAPGTCSKCHTPSFRLKPKSHDEPGFFPGGHAEMAKENKTEADKAKEEHAAKLAAEGKTEGEDTAQIIAAQRQHGSESSSESIGASLPTVESVFYCSTCHTEQFCSNCHGMEMPHPAEFKEPKNSKDSTGHPAVSKAKAEKCIQCHGENETTHFCDECHHGKAVAYIYDKKIAWATQHPKAVAKSGLKVCEKCHSANFCADCHTGRKVVPTSHKDRNWLRPVKQSITSYGKKAAEPSAKHALEANKSMDSCAVCHGTGGTNAKFCKSCHKIEMPHTDTFKKQHVSGKKTPRTCRRCHNWKELCSNCHHVDSSLSRPWIKVHGVSTNKNGSASCLEKCHKKVDCANCHQKRKVVPASHKSKKFVRDYGSKDAGHVGLYNKDGEICTYCHKGTADELPNSKFCIGCHKVLMPHPKTYGLKDPSQPAQNDNGGDHAELLKKAKTALPATCANCHRQYHCDTCHHKGSNPKKTWKSQHNTFVKKNGAAGCFGSGKGCHEETFCSYCHVRLAQ